MQKTKSNCQDNATGQGFETLLRREPRQKPTKEEPGADSSWRALDLHFRDVFCEWSCNSGGRDVVSCCGKMVRFMLSRLSPSIIFNLVHVLAQKKEWHSHGYNGRKQTWLPPLSHFVVRFPPSGETAKKNVKQVVNLSYAQSFFADAESMETVTTFLQPWTAHLNHSSLYFDFSQSDDRNHFSVSITVVLQDSARFRAQIFK